MGYAAAAEYVVPKGKGFKARGQTTHYTHKFHDEGGRWPKVYADQFGNMKFVGGTFSINKWIRR